MEQYRSPQSRSRNNKNMYRSRRTVDVYETEDEVNSNRDDGT